MYYREFDAEIRKNGVEGTKTLYDRGNFFINYYLSRTQFWIAVVIVDRGYVKGCVVVSNSDRKRLINAINTTPIKSFSDIIRKHTEAVLNKGLAIPIPSFAIENYAKAGLKELFKKLKIIEMPKITSRLKRVTPAEQFALPDSKLVEQVAVKRGKVPCPNCEEEYLHFKGKVEGKTIITCKHCGICYYK